MNRPSTAAQGFEALTISDFELVRNAKGEWLLIVSQAPAPFLDNPLQTLSARVDAGGIVVQSGAAKMHLQNILSSQYMIALETDKPAALYFSVVDDDGSKQFSASVPVIWD
ncbi:MAG: hypothetical protein SFW65_04610 [Alphaproteobacteria bacterium]|nr:hypothetical protein [Alphaproteobacteria bacterium]